MILTYRIEFLRHPTSSLFGTAEFHREPTPAFILYLLQDTVARESFREENRFWAKPNSLLNPFRRDEEAEQGIVIGEL